MVPSEPAHTPTAIALDTDPTPAQRAHRELAARRAPGQTLIRLHGPDSELGPRLQVVVDDMPLLVGNLRDAARRAGVVVTEMAHPVLAVTRDDEGNLGTVGHSTQVGGDASPETWIEIGLAPDTGEERLQRFAAAAEQALARAAQVRGDADEVADRFSGAVRTLIASPRGSAPADFATWLASGNARLLGYLGDGDGSGLGVLRAPELAAQVRATVDRMAPPAPGFLEIVDLAHPLGDAAGAPFLLITRPQLGGSAEVFPVALTVQGLHENVLDIPTVAPKVERVLARLGLTQTSYSGQRILELMQTFPRLRMVVGTEDELVRIFGALRDMTDDELELFLRTDQLGTFATALVYLPRDRYTSRARGALIEVLQERTGLAVDRFTARVTESATARIQFVLLPRDDEQTVPVFGAELEAQLRDELADASRTWEDDLVAAAAASDTADTALVGRYLTGFSPNYKEDQSTAAALADIVRIEGLAPDGMDLTFYDRSGEADAGDADLGFTMYLAGGTVTLSQLLPVLQSLGVEVVDERPYRVVRPDGVVCSVYDFGLRVPPALRAAAVGDIAEADRGAALDRLRTLAADGVAAVWRGDAEVDRFNELIFALGLDWREVTLLRGIGLYLRQCGFGYTLGHMAQVLLASPQTVAALVELWAAAFDPDGADSPESGVADAGRAQVAQEKVDAALAAVTSLDADRILRAYLHVGQATVRTNFYQRDADGNPPAVLSLKLEPGRIPEAPKPRPRFEIFVYSPRVEGVHLRFGMVARGGLRWSDRREDFRTEVLGLVKAQAVKNAVIVPVGAKGGFVVKRPPEATGDPAVDRQNQLAEGIACYKLFIGGLLGVTDNLDGNGTVVHPDRVVRRDGDDTYLVVAADKGTASFSDIANGVAAEHDFWLGDAFASGGSEGYDHKGMGITARGAWESVKMHFREMGHDTQTQDFTAVGIGDMSGDVFGNGMLLSEHIRLVAAFDHRDVFLDPNPDAATGFAERTRMFALPRSSWKDYDTSLISAGGGVYSRDQKSIEITPQVRVALGLGDDVTELSPPELIRAILLAPVDLLWNGGIGTYVKASTETDLSVGDRANDAIRVDGAQVRAKVIGEGGNLGVTPRGRIEFDRSGGRINTDAMDNSAGVDCSDHEVNIKVLLDRQIAGGAIPAADRHDLLVSMTDDVADLVLADNVSQNTALSVERSLAPSLLDVHARLLRQLATDRGVDLKLEALPEADEVDELLAGGKGLSSPELCNLMAHVKLTVKEDILGGDLPDNELLTAGLPGYFPAALVQRAGEAVTAHPLRREIVTTQVVNEMVDNGGITYAFRLGEEVGAEAADAARAFLVATRVFGADVLWARIRGLAEPSDSGSAVPAVATAALIGETRRVLDRGARWLLTNRPQPLAMGAEINRYRSRVAALGAQMADWDIDYDQQARGGIAKAVAAGVPEELAQQVCTALYRFSLLDIVDIADVTETDDAAVGRLYFALMQHLRVDAMLGAVAELPRGDRWREMARLALRDDLYGALRALCVDVLSYTDPVDGAQRQIEEWEAHNAPSLRRVRSLLAEVLDQGLSHESGLSVATRALRSLLRSVA